MSLWDQLLVGAVVVIVLIWWGPGIKATLEQSRRAENKDWRGFLLPIAVVVVFVLLLLAFV